MAFDPARALMRFTPEEQEALLDYQLEHATPKETVKPKLVHFAETVDDAKKLIANDGEIIGLSTGWPSVDEMFLGMQAGQLIVVYGPTKHRKSIFVQNLAAHVAEAGNPVLFIGLELVKEQNTERWLNMGYDNLPIVYPEDIMPDYKDIDAIVEVAVEQGIKLVVVDHLHMWRVGKSGMSKADLVTDICQEMKAIAMKHQVPLILVSHISGDKTATGPPDVSRLKDSTSIAQLSDKVVCVYSPGVELDVPDNHIEVSLKLSRRLSKRKDLQLLIMPNAKLVEPTKTFSPDPKARSVSMI